MIERYPLASSYTISRIIKGGWHLAGGHGTVDPSQSRRDMARFVEAGITTFDCADIYTGVEESIGLFRREYPALARQVQVHTKFVPDLSGLRTLDATAVERIIDRSLARLGQEQLDLVQFSWWDYSVERYVDAALALARLQRAGKIARIGLTNFDLPRLRQLVDAGISVTSHQVQYSLLDDRPEHGMVDYCRAHGILLLCYGTVAGGFLSERWLGCAAPETALANRSLVKYRLMIDEFGGWDLFQNLLRVLKQIAEQYHADIASVATRVILDRPQVAAAIVGAVNTSHLHEHEKIASLQLTAEDIARIVAVTTRRRGPAGDVYDLERDRTGVHGRIMKYDLNIAPAPP